MSHLIKDRHGTYYTRRIIPPALRPFMPEPWRGKSEWKRTLGTKDPKEAKRANIAMLARMQAAFTAAEMRQKATTRESLTDEEIKALADWYGLEAIFGLTINPQNPSRRRLALTVLRKSVEVAPEKLARLDGDGSEAAEPWTPPQDGTVLPVKAPLAGDLPPAGPADAARLCADEVDRPAPLPRAIGRTERAR